MFRLAPQPPPSRSPKCPELLRKVPRHLTFTRSHTFHPLVDRNRYVPLPRKSSAFQRGAFSEASARCLTSGNSLTTSTRCGFAFTHRTIFGTSPSLTTFLFYIDWRDRSTISPPSERLDPWNTTRYEGRIVPIVHNRNLCDTRARRRTRLRTHTLKATITLLHDVALPEQTSRGAVCCSATPILRSMPN